MNKLFKFFIKIHMFLYRLSRGRFGGSVQGLHVLLLTTTGRKSWKKRTTPLGYFMDDAAYVVIGSNAGSEKHPAWFLNIKNNPYVTIKVKNKQLQAIAKITNPEERNKLWIKLLELAPSYKTYQKRTAREIPIVLLRVEDTGT